MTASTTVFAMDISAVLLFFSFQRGDCLVPYLSMGVRFNLGKKKGILWKSCLC